jgi:arabinan endo-1,5-alpha-L-arabinosidase
MRFIRMLLLILLLVAIVSACKPIPEELRPFYEHKWGDLANSRPVFNQDFPDPDVIEVDGTFYAFATIAMGRNIQAASSKDLLNWTWLKDALPKVPSWALKGDTWAPDVTPAPDGSGYLMYFVVRSKKYWRQCIGVAQSQDPAGPYASTSDEPLVCQTDEGGSIDPASFKHPNGKRYLLWKNDGNCCRLPTWLYIQELSQDGLTLVGEPVRLITTSLPWEGELIEAPTLFLKDNRYYLFYSASAYYDKRYATGVAVSDQLLGPYTKQESPILSSGMAGSSWIGPGGQDVVIGPDGETYLAFHGWDKYQIRRALYIEKLYWRDGLPSLLSGDTP